VRRIGHIGELQTLTDDNDDWVPPATMIQRLLADNQQMAHSQREAIETCDRNRDTPTGNILQDVLGQTEKRIWFLFEMAQGAER